MIFKNIPQLTPRGRITKEPLLGNIITEEKKEEAIENEEEYISELTAEEFDQMKEFVDKKLSDYLSNTIEPKVEEMIDIIRPFKGFKIIDLPEEADLYDIDKIFIETNENVFLAKTSNNVEEYHEIDDVIKKNGLAIQKVTVNWDHAMFAKIMKQRKQRMQPVSPFYS